MCKIGYNNLQGSKRKRSLKGGAECKMLCRMWCMAMCDVDKYFDIYKDIKQLKSEDALQLILEARSQEERDFFNMIGNYLLQQKQKQVIKRNLY